MKYEAIFKKKISGSENDWSVFELWFVMSFSVGCYKVVALYYETWRPGEFCVRKPWWFVFRLFLLEAGEGCFDSSITKREERGCIQMVALLLTHHVFYFYNFLTYLRKNKKSIKFSHLDS